MKSLFGTDRARGRTASSSSSWSMPPQRPFAQRKPAAPRGIAVTPVSAPASASTIQRVTDEQQEILDSLPALIAGQPLRALQLLDSLDAADLSAIVAALSDDDFDVLLTQVRGESAGLVPFALPYAELVDTIRHERVAAVAETMEGNLNWIASGLSDRLTPSLSGRNVRSGDQSYKTNAFTTWLVNNGPEPALDSSMNCWESCLFAAYRAGILPKGALFTIYQGAIKRTHMTAQTEMSKIAQEQHVQPTLQMVSQQVNAAYQEALGVYLGVNEAEPWQEDDAAPPRGSLVFFNGVAHVALALGNLKNGSPEVMSLWYLPGPQPVMKRASIEEILANAHNEYNITFGPVPW